MDKLREHEAAHKAATADGEWLKGLLKKKRLKTTSSIFRGCGIPLYDHNQPVPCTTTDVERRKSYIFGGAWLRHPTIWPRPTGSRHTDRIGSHKYLLGLMKPYRVKWQKVSTLFFCIATRFSDNLAGLPATSSVLPLGRLLGWASTWIRPSSPATSSDNLLGTLLVRVGWCIRPLLL